MKLVWDTSSLSHAFEDLTHAIGSAVTYCAGKVRCDVKRFLRRRFRSEHDARDLLLDCDVNTCIIPTDISRELMRNPQMRDELEFLVYGDETEMIRRYGRRARNAGRLFKPRLKVKPVKDEYFMDVVRVARKNGINISEQDMKAVALAYQEGATLITADRKMKELAEILGVSVIYTVGEEVRKVNYPTLSERVLQATEK